LLIDETTNASAANVATGGFKNEDDTIRKMSLIMPGNVCSESQWVFNKIIQNLWPADVKFENMPLLITEVALYMKERAV
jgi:hypothetical protein